MSQQVELFIANKDMLFIEELLKKAGPKEVGALGTITYNEEGQAFVSNLFIPRQTVSGSEVDWGDDGVLDFLDYLMEIGFDAESYGIYSVHSHNNMGVFWSGTDENFITECGKSGVPYMISSVFNNKKEAKHRLDVFFEAENHAPVLDRGYQHVMWKADGDVGLTVVYEDDVLDAVQGLRNMRKSLEKKQKEIEEEYKPAIEQQEGKIGELQKAVRDGAKESIEAVWEERVTIQSYRYSGGKGSSTPRKVITSGDGWDDTHLGMGYDTPLWQQDDKVDDKLFDAMIGDPSDDDVVFEDCVYGDLFDYKWDTQEAGYSYLDESGNKYVIDWDISKSCYVKVMDLTTGEEESITVEKYLDNNADTAFHNDELAQYSNEKYILTSYIVDAEVTA